MTRKDFELIAATLRASRPHNFGALHGRTHFGKGEDYQWQRTVEAFAERLHAANPNFLTGRFYRAAGLVGED